jgi:DNA mismatch repair protein MutS2
MTSFAPALAKLEFEKVRERILHYAASDPGREKIQQLGVSTSLHAVRQELALVTEMKKLLEQEEAFPLDGIHPIRTSVQKAAIEGTVLPGKELAQIVSTVRASRTARTFLSRRKDEYPLLWASAETLSADKVLEFNIDQAVDETGAVRATASRDLQTIRRSIADRYEVLKKRLSTILREVSELGFSQEEIITTREGRMVIPVKSEHKNRVPGFIHSASSSGATVFIEPTETLELNNEITNLQFEEQREIDRILRGLTVQVGKMKQEILDSLDILAELDCLSARAKYSIEVVGVAPGLNDEGTLRLVDARHPLLLLAHGRSGTVPLSLELGEHARTLIISGPNAGGKSVAMKCVGLLALMTQAGIHIPASDQTVMRIFTRVLVDIGDEQSIESDLSTFSSHLRNLKGFVEEADKDSLVLIDEIGAGTDPGEGGAIAAAVLEKLTQVSAYTIATTHHGFLKVFAHETSGVENGAMEFDQATLTPTYRFRSGTPGSSYALEMAERLGFQPSLMNRSRILLGEGQHRLESLISQLESSLQQNRLEADTLAREQTRASALVRTYEDRMSKLQAELKEMRRKAVEEAREIVERANAVIEQSVREIREGGADRTSARTARENVQQMKDELARRSEELADAASPPSAPLGPGSSVTIRGTGNPGEIVSIAPDRKSAVVVFGQVKMRVPLGDLRSAQNRELRSDQVAEIRTAKMSSAAHELDVRGMTGDEALPLLDKFIDDAILAGYGRVDVIHGKGTGALRKKVTEFLQHHPRVRSCRIAEWNEGGTGATVVELKQGE